MTAASLRRLQRHTNTLTALERNHYLPGLETKEDDVAHSYSVAMIAWRLHEAVGSNLSLEKILKYALVHDFVEVYAGDVNTFASAEERAQKELDERDALDKLTAEYADAEDFSAALHAYEQQADGESAFVWSCDKIQALLQGQLDAWRCYHELGITLDHFVDKIAEQRTRIHPDLLEFFDEFTRQCIESYRDTVHTETTES